MCGIVGKVGGLLPEQWFGMVALTTVRGEDASGLVWVNRSGVVKHTKQPIPLMALAYRQRHLVSMPVLVGHARLATQGAPSDNRNNHPFDSGRFIVAHNGMIFNDSEFPLRGQCDSEAIIHALREAGDVSTERAIEAAHQRLQGLVTVALLDRRDPGAVWLWRNQAGYDVYYAIGPDASAFCSLKLGLEAYGMRAVRLDADTAVRLTQRTIQTFPLPPTAAGGYRTTAYPYTMVAKPGPVAPTTAPLNIAIPTAAPWPDETTAKLVTGADVTSVLPIKLKALVLQTPHKCLCLGDAVALDGGKELLVTLDLFYEGGKFKLDVEVEKE